MRRREDEPTDRELLLRVLELYEARARTDPKMATDELRAVHLRGIATGYALWALERPAQLRAHLSVVARSGHLPEDEPR